MIIIFAISVAKRAQWAGREVWGDVEADFGHFRGEGCAVNREEGVG